MTGFDLQGPMGFEGPMPRPVRLLGDGLGLQSPAAEGKGFEGVLDATLGRVDALQDEVKEKFTGLAAGEQVELHDLMASMGKSEVAFNLMLEVKNRLVDAWDKLSRSVM